MSIADFDPEILQDFLTECGELLDALETDLVELESRADDLDLVNQVFRALHTIKGSASFLALTNLVEIAHAAETALNAARAGEAQIDSASMDLLLKAIDVIRIQFGELSGGETELTKANDTLVQGLIAFAEGGETTPEGTTTAVASEDEQPQSVAEGERPLVLDPSRADLLDHFAADLDDQIDKLGEQLGRLADDAERAGAVESIAEIGSELSTTIDFFEFGEMLELASATTEAVAAAAALESEAIEQLVPRLGAIAKIMAEQSEGLRRSVLVTPEIGDLVDRVRALASGTVDEAWKLPPGAGADEALAHDLGATSAPEPARAADEQQDEPSGSSPTPPAGDDTKKPETKKVNAPEQTLRVEVSRLESLMNLVGELVLQKNRITELAGRVARETEVETELSEQLELAGGQLDRITGDIQVAVMRTRMQPLDKLFGKYPRLIRDLAGKTGKQIQLKIEGGETEVDKSVIEELGDPLVHLMRNSADHGLESPEERTAAGKDATGTITLRASHEGNNVRLLIIDNGRGLNRDRIAAKAIERGLVKEADVENLPDEEVHKFIFLPGFSTAGEISDLSGRGVGMDVVRTNIEKIKGTITVESTEGKGTTFTILIPLTVAIMPAMMVEVAGETYAIPLNNIVEIVRPTEQQLGSIIEERVVRLRDAVLPLLSAEDLLGVPDDRRSTPEVAVVLSAGDRHMGMLVQRVIGQQEIVIKPLEGVHHNGPVSGATVRNDGGVSLIMDITRLASRTD